MIAERATDRMPAEIAEALYHLRPSESSLACFRIWLVQRSLDEIAALCAGPPINVQSMAVIEADPRVIDARHRRHRPFG
jgi:hypothetical protein